MWICPKCKHKFYNKNQSHSCGHYSVDEFLAGKPLNCVELFEEFLRVYREIGEFEIHPVKTRVALLTKMRFCSINKIGKDYIDIHLVLTKAYSEIFCFFKIDNLEKRFFVHHTRIKEKEDISEELKYFMKLAYEVGLRKHVLQKSRK